MRRTFLDILNNMKIKPSTEYSKLYELFYEGEDGFRLYELINNYFYRISFRGTCISLYEFDRSNNINFGLTRQSDDINYLISFCEYIINFVNECFKIPYIKSRYDLGFLQQQVLAVVNKLEYTSIDKNGIISFVPNLPESKYVAQCVSDELSIKVLEYNHHELKGDLSAKKTILFKIADELEPQKEKLKEIDNQLQKDLFLAFNNFNIRHNNITVGSPKYSAPFTELTPDVQEKIYDYIYSLSLIAFIKLENDADKGVFDGIKQQL